MMNRLAAAPEEKSRAYDAVLVEYQTVRLRPRLVFDDLTRTAFDACAALAEEVYGAHLPGRHRAPDVHVRCGLGTEGPGAFHVSFEIPECEDRARAPRPAGRLLPRMARRPAPIPFSEDLQFELLSTTRIIDDMLLAVDAVCSVPSGSLRAARRGRSSEGMIELIDGIRVVRRVHSDAWELLHCPGTQALVRRVLAPFTDPELYTMGVSEITPLGNPGANWIITSNRRLSGFAAGERLELPEPAPSSDLDDAGTSPWN